MRLQVDDGGPQSRLGQQTGGNRVEEVATDAADAVDAAAWDGMDDMDGMDQCEGQVVGVGVVLVELTPSLCLSRAQLDEVAVHRPARRVPGSSQVRLSACVQHDELDLDQAWLDWW